MHENEIWQVFANNGAPIDGRGEPKENFDNDPTLIMANAHVWFWKLDAGKIDILLQKRSLLKSNKPGWFHISAGGHINLGETALETAVRETREEMGLEIDANKLHFVQSTRIIEKDPRDIVNVFLYRLNGDEKFSFLDGEVDSYLWISLDDFKKMTLDAPAYKLVPQGRLYFDTLISALEYIAQS